MGEWGSLVAIVAASLIIGWLIVIQFTRDARLSLPTAFASLTLGVIGAGWLALVLAEFGRYSTVTWLITIAGFAVLLVMLTVWRQRSGRWAAAPDAASGRGEPLFPALPGWVELLFLGGWLVVAGWLFLRPHEYVAGASDAGVYVNLSASIDREGSFLIDDDGLAGLPVSLYPSLLRPLPNDPVAPSYLLPGFYVIGEPAGEITPQFYPLHPLWQAVGFGLAQPLAAWGDAPASDTAAGVGAALRMSGLWALLGSLAVYLTVRQYAGWETAALALVALSLTALQVWFARYPTTEMLTQYLLWAGLFGLSLWLAGDGPAPLWALLSGAALGQVFLVRIDILVIVPVLGLLVLWVIFGGRRAVADRASVAWFVAPLFLLAAHSLLHGYWQSRPYFVVHTGLGVQLLQANWLIPLVVVAAAVAGVWLVRRWGGRLSDMGQPYYRVALGALVAVTLTFALYGWFVRPVVGQTMTRPDAFSEVAIPLLDHLNWPRLGWYLSPVGLALGVAGTCLLIWRLNRRMALVLAVGALFAVVYLWRLQANPHQIYAMRRFVPAVVPFLTVAASIFIGWLARKPAWWVRGTAVVLAVAWLGGLAWSARGFVSQIDYADLTAELQQFDATLDPRAVLLFDDPAPIGQGDFFGTPLKFLFGHEVYTVRDKSMLDEAALVDMLELWHNMGRSVYWIGDPAWLAEQGLAHDTRTHTLTSQHLESTYDHKPVAIVPDVWQLTVSRVMPPDG